MTTMKEVFQTLNCLTVLHACGEYYIPCAASASTVLPSGQISTLVISPREPYLCTVARSLSQPCTSWQAMQ